VGELGLFCGVYGSLLQNIYLVPRGDSLQGTRLSVAVEEVDFCALLWKSWVSFVGDVGLFCGIHTWYPEATVSKAIGWALRYSKWNLVLFCGVNGLLLWHI